MSQYNQCTTLGGTYPIMSWSQILGRVLIIFGIIFLFQSHEWVRNIITFFPVTTWTLGTSLFCCGILLRSKSISFNEITYRFNRSLLYVAFLFFLLMICNFIFHFRQIGFWESVIPVAYSLMTVLIFFVILAFRMFILKDERM